MKSKEAKPITNGEAKSIDGVRIVTPGNGSGPFCGQGTKVIDLKTGKEIENVREIHVHIVPNDVVRAEIVLFPSEVEITGAEAKITTVSVEEICPGLTRLDVVRWLYAHGQAGRALSEKFERVFGKDVIETTPLADKYRRFKRTETKITTPNIIRVHSYSAGSRQIIHRHPNWLIVKWRQFKRRWRRQPKGDSPKC